MVAIVFEDVASAITSPCDVITRSVESAGIGWTKNIVKDFLAPTATTAKILRVPHCRKRKCCAVRLDSLPNDLQVKLQHGKIH